jgi:hypothetical protein
VRKKSIRIIKKYYVLIFCSKKRREKKKLVSFFCGVIFGEDSFRDIVREKKENLSMMRGMYQAANVIKVW